jgi:prepilin-type N-terminal cleavage/methylation domain-containing protein
MKNRSPIRLGFTLVEVLVAIAIMGTGLLMAGALFPAAIRETRSSTVNSVGIMMCENGIDAVRLSLRDADCSIITTNNAFISVTAAIGNDANWLGSATMSTQVLLRQMPSAVSNDYQVVAVSCALSNTSKTLDCRAIDATLADNGDGTMKITVGSGEVGMLALRSPVILPDGSWSTISGKSDTTAFLDTWLGWDVTNQPNVKVWLFAEKEGGNYSPVSPALSVMVTRTALK